MVDFLNDDVTFEGEVTTRSELIVDGGLTIGPGGVNVGESVANPAESWPGQTRVQVADVTERDAVVAWRAANTPITPTTPLLVWRANGSITGVNEITVDGTNWYAESPMAGDIEMTMAAAAPYGWLLCQGQLLANAATNYPALWAAASPAYRVGSDLRLPDLRGRVPMGAGQGSSLTLRNIGDAVGAEAVQLSTLHLPSHYHSISHTHPAGSTDFAGIHRHLFQGTFGAMDPGGNNGLRAAGGYTYTENEGNHQHAFTVPTFYGNSSVVGGDTAHPNVQPSAIVNFKVKV
jgi:microcystin-dependent protein